MSSRCGLLPPPCSGAKQLPKGWGEDWQGVPAQRVRTSLHLFRIGYGAHPDLAIPSTLSSQETKRPSLRYPHSSAALTCATRTERHHRFANEFYMTELIIYTLVGVLA